MDYRQQIENAASFGDILDVFLALFPGVVSQQWNKAYAAGKQLREYVQMLETGNLNPEAEYFALSKVQNFLYVSDVSVDEEKSILAKHRDAFAGKGGKLFNHYVSAGASVLGESGTAEKITEYRSCDVRLKRLEADQMEEIRKIAAEYDPLTEKAEREFIAPFFEKTALMRAAYYKKNDELLALPRTPTRDEESKRQWDEYLAAAEEVDRAKKEAMDTHILPIMQKRNAKVAEIDGNAAGSEIKSLRKKQEEVENEIHNKIVSFLLDKSPVSPEDAETWINENVIMNRQAVEKAKKAGYKPEDVMRDLAEFYRMTGGRLPRLAFSTTRNSRSMASHGTGNLYVGSGFSKTTFYHELAHLLENDPKILASAFTFLERRRESGTHYSLSKLTANRRYGSNETAYKDKWIDPYVGKIYAGSTEVFSMGMQMLANPKSLIGIAEKDPEHLSLMLGMCATKPYIDEEKVTQLQAEVKEKKQRFAKTKDFLKDLDRKIAKAGNFWEGHIYRIEPLLKDWRRKRPYAYQVLLNEDGHGGYHPVITFRSEKAMYRALYLWILNGKQENGAFSLHGLAPVTDTGSPLLPPEILSMSIADIPKNGETNE